ncbi:MAG: penicillin-binding protein [Oscillospiraceae bacterium]|nr:penicillin-binding protein [Oscillospiraceae bacterium]
MKKVKRRANAALLLAAAVLLGMGLYVWRFAAQGRSWVNFRANQHIYSAGSSVSGTVTDRYGVVLAGTAEGERTFSTDAALRVACLHAVGDRQGNIGTGALSAFADKLTGYDVLAGVTDSGGVVSLSIDSELNRTAYAALAGRKGAVLLGDYTTGEILCMVSSPSYDPETGFDGTDPWYEGVYLNRCLSAAYTPGSVFKLVTLAAALDRLDGLDDRIFHCDGSVTVDGNEIVCSGVHGDQTVEQALANSCNVAFAELGLEAGASALRSWGERLGFTGSLTVSGIPTTAGRLEPGEDGSAALAWSGIGQNTDLVCPLAMLRYVSAIAGGGTGRECVLLAGEKGAAARLLPASAADKLKAMMNYNVIYSYGAGSFPGLTLCAKSGTAEVGDGSSHAWFTGFLDDPGHPYAFVVVIENGGGGLRNAGPVANAVLQAAVERSAMS